MAEVEDGSWSQDTTNEVLVPPLTEPEANVDNDQQMEI